MHTSYIGLGSNLGDRQNNITEAVEKLSKIGITTCSPIYETEPFGYADQPWFLNAIVKLETELSTEALFEHTSSIEKELGKNTPFKNGPRTIDIDILLFDDLVLEHEDLTIPHPHMHERNTVLVPLHDIAPNVIHPKLHKTIKELLESSSDSGEIKLSS